MRRRFERRRPPILEVIAGWTDGPPPALPDEGPQDGRTIRWGAGALDGVLARHVDSAPEPARGAELAMLIEHAATGDEEARIALYEAARADGIVFALDEALDALDGVPRESVAELGRSLLHGSQHREPLKLAVALVGRAGDRDDVPLLETLARHDEFSRVAGVALANLLEDPVAAWWRVGCLATGWGKVEAVGRLAEQPSLPADVRAWLLRHGCDNAVTPEYLAYACATAGGLETALDGLVDDELLDGACTILRALVRGGPAEDISDYEPGPRVVATVVELVAERPSSLPRLSAVVEMRRWAEDYEEHVAIAERCGRVLMRAMSAASSPSASSTPTTRSRCGRSPRRSASTRGRRAGGTCRPRPPTPPSTTSSRGHRTSTVGRVLRGSPRRSCRSTCLAPGHATSCSPPPSTASRHTRCCSSCRTCARAAGRPCSFRPGC